MEIFPILTAAATSVLAVAAVIGLVIRPFSTVNAKIEKVGQDLGDDQRAIGRNIDQQAQQLTELIGVVGEIKGALPHMTDRISNLESWRNVTASGFKPVPPS